MRITNRNHLLIILLPLLILFWGCLSAGPSPENRPQSPYNSFDPWERGLQALEGGKPLEAYMVYMENREIWPESEDPQEWLKKVEGSLQEERENAREQQAWKDYARFHQSLRIIESLRQDDPARALSETSWDVLLDSLHQDDTMVTLEKLARIYRLTGQSSPPPSSGGPPSIPGEVQPALEGQMSPRRVIPGVVTIWVDRGLKIERGVGYPDRVIGTGFFIDQKGYLITNYHVIASEVDPDYEGYSRLFIKSPENPQERIPARVVGYDPAFDLALLKCEVEAPYVMNTLNADGEAETGDTIFAIGSPGGLESTATAGIVSAVGREFLPLGEVFQVDVPINPGNSGGPLLGRDGKFYGVVFAGIEVFEGVNFAIPADYLNLVVPGLFEGGPVTHGWLGMAVYESSDSLEVIYVFPGSPADSLGIKRGDEILGINGVDQKKKTELQRELLRWDPGTLVSLHWKRGNQVHHDALLMSERPQEPLNQALLQDARQEVMVPLFGMTLERIGKTLWDEEYRVVRLYPGMPADEGGLSVNDSFTLRRFHVDEEHHAALIRIAVKKRKAGYMKSVMQLASYLEKNIFL